MTTDEKKIAKLVERIRNGDSKAENILFQQFEKKIELIVRTRLEYKVPVEDVNDIVAEVKKALLVALRQGYFKPERNHALSTYTVGIANNQIALYFRKQNSADKRSEENIPDIPNQNKSYLDKMISDEEKKRLLHHLSRLKPIHKQVLELRIYQNKSIDEISNILNLEKKQVIDLIHYAQKKIVKKCRNDKFFSIFSILLQILI